MDDDLSRMLKDVLQTQSELVGKISTIEKKIDTLTKQQNLRSIASVSDILVNEGMIVSSQYSMELVDLIYELEILKKSEYLTLVMRTTDLSFTSGEREGPSDPMPMLSGHYKTMLKRYIFAGRIFCSGKRVYDCCCGRGWGTYLLSSYAKNVHAIDKDPQLISENRKYWPAKNIHWRAENVLMPGHFEPEYFDVVTGMEIIEHFTKDEGIKLFDNIQTMLKPGGIFIGTTFFPDNRHQADNHQTLKRPDHLFLWTNKEIVTEFEKYFEEIFIIDNWMIIAKKKML